MEDLQESLDRLEASIRSPGLVDLEFSKFDNIDFPQLLLASEDSLPECFDIGLFGNGTEKYIPALLPFSKVRGIAFSIDKASEIFSFNEIMERSFCRMASQLHQNSFEMLLIDGKNDGIGFSYISKLRDNMIGKKVYDGQDDILEALEGLQDRRDGKFLFILINNFPHGFTNKSAAKLYKIITTTNISSVKTMMTKEFQPRSSMSDIDNAFSQELAELTLDDKGFCHFNDLAELNSVAKTLTLSYGSLFSKDEMISFIEAASAISNSYNTVKMMAKNIDSDFSVKIGLSEGRQINFTLGSSNSNYHAIIAGRSGKGKTVLLDNIITNAATSYTPDELRLVLVDMKGIEFSEYIDLPHTQAFFSSSNTANAVKVIEFLSDEIKLRENLFRKVGASSFSRYKTLSGQIMPRFLVIIDEFQNLFSGNYKTDAFVEEVLIKRVLRLGRAYGIHLICCTQSLGDGVRSSFLNNIPLRIAFQMTRDQSQSFLSTGNTSAKSLKVGEVIYNDQDGLVSSNRLATIDYLSESDIEKRVKSSVEKNRCHDEFDKMIIT